jgi:hypothetical protein
MSKIQIFVITNNCKTMLTKFNPSLSDQFEFKGKNGFFDQTSKLYDYE